MESTCCQLCVRGHGGPWQLLSAPPAAPPHLRARRLQRRALVGRAVPHGNLIPRLEQVFGPAERVQVDVCEIQCKCEPRTTSVRLTRGEVGAGGWVGTSRAAPTAAVCAPARPPVHTHTHTHSAALSAHMASPMMPIPRKPMRVAPGAAVGTGAGDEAAAARHPRRRRGRVAAGTHCCCRCCRWAPQMHALLLRSAGRAWASAGWRAVQPVGQVAGESPRTRIVLM